MAAAQVRRRYVNGPLLSAHSRLSARDTRNLCCPDALHALNRACMSGSMRMHDAARKLTLLTPPRAQTLFGPRASLQILHGAKVISGDHTRNPETCLRTLTRSTRRSSVLSAPLLLPFAACQ